MAEDKLKRIIENAAKIGSFGKDFKFVELIASDKEGEDQFASDVIFAQVRVERGSVQKNISVVIKRQQKLEVVRKMMGSDKQFFNEHLMYSEILPFLIDKNNVLKDIFPKSYHTFATLGENFEEDIVVVEDLKEHGFKLTEEKLFLDFDHCVLAVEALGKFHALSYVMKQVNMEEFLKKMRKLKEAQCWESPDKEATMVLLMTAIERGVLPLVEAGESVPVLQKFLERVRDPVGFRKELERPEEPTAVLCHGDFNRNNMLFRYDDNGKPVAVKLFDIATSRYTSPAIDLAFFLFMNTTTELRNVHWDELLRAYHRSLSSTAPPGCKVPTLEEVHAELRGKGVYGYIICSFFIPMMMDSTGKSEVEDFINMTPEEVLEFSKNRGGEKVTKIVSDVVRDLLKIGAL